MRPSAFDQDEAFALLCQLVAIRSYPGEERAAQEAVAQWLLANGPRAGDLHQCTEWVDRTTLAPCADLDTITRTPA